MDLEESVAETTETRRVARPRGVRLWLSVVLVGFGIVLVAAAATAHVAERGVAMPGGIFLIVCFGYVAVGGNGIKVKTSGDGLEAGVDLAQDTTVHTTFVTKGFPRQGVMPPKHGTMPPKEGDSPLQKTADSEPSRGS